MSVLLRKLLIIAVCIVVFFTVYVKDTSAETVGVIVTHGVYSHEKAFKEFQSYLAKKGYKNRLKFIIQRPYPDPIAWSNAARKLIAADVDVMVTYGAPVTFSAIREKADIPIIYAGVYEPLVSKIKAKNVTGVCSRYPISSLVRYLRASTTIKKLGVIYSSMEEDSRYQLFEVKKLSKKYGFAVTPLNLRRPVDIAGMLSNIDVSAFFITSSSIVNSVFPTILHIAGSRKIPTASLIQYDGLSATIVLSSQPEEQGRVAAEKLIEFLKGVPIRDIPATCSKNIELIFNMKDAHHLGIRISMDLVTEATRIIY
jgi:putative ABC transport system substrate-binding protein